MSKTPPSKTESKPTHGGKRQGAGRKKKEGETKEKYAVSLYPEQKKAIVKAHGSLTKAILKTLPPDPL